MHTLTSSELTEMRKRQIKENEASRKVWRQRHQKRSLWGCNEYVDDDFVSRALVKWTFAQLVQYSKLLLILINRRISMPSQQKQVLPNHVASLVYYSYPCEYYETLFADYTMIPVAEEESISFRSYYTQIYKSAVEALKNPLTHEQRLYHSAKLRGCFMVALTYDARIRRFVFSKHDIHNDYLQTHPPPLKKTTHFIERLQPLVDQFLQGHLDIQSLADEACAIWISLYMFLLE